MSVSSREQNESFTAIETNKDVELINKNIEEQQPDNSEKDSLTTLQQTINQTQNELNDLISKDIALMFNTRPCKQMDLITNYSAKSWLNERPEKICFFYQRYVT